MILRNVASHTLQVLHSSFKGVEEVITACTIPAFPPPANEELQHLWEKMYTQVWSGICKGYKSNGRYGVGVLQEAFSCMKLAQERLLTVNFFLQISSQPFKQNNLAPCNHISS
jgi:hypothetical protein